MPFFVGHGVRRSRRDRQKYARAIAASRRMEWLLLRKPCCAGRRKKRTVQHRSRGTIKQETTKRGEKTQIIACWLLNRSCAPFRGSWFRAQCLIFVIKFSPFTAFSEPRFVDFGTMKDRRDCSTGFAS